MTDAARNVESIQDDWSVPHNLEAEMALLGAFLVNNAALDKVSMFLKAEHFSEGLHGRLYATISEMIGRGHVVSPVTLVPYYRDDPAMAELGGVSAYLGKLAAMAAPIINVEEYAREVYELARRRTLIDIGSDLVVEARSPDPGVTVSDIIEKTEKALYEVAEESRFGQGFVAFSEAMKEAIDMANAAYQRDGGLSGISTGLKDLDEKLGGLQPSDLTGPGRTLWAIRMRWKAVSSHSSRWKCRRNSSPPVSSPRKREFRPMTSVAAALPKSSSRRWWTFPRRSTGCRCSSTTPAV